MLDRLAGTGQHTENIESNLRQHHISSIPITRSIASSADANATYRLAQRPTLSHRHLVTFLDTERGRDVRRQVLMSLLVSGVFGDEVEVFAADDEGTVHFRGDDGAGEDTTADRDEAGEGAFLVYSMGENHSVRVCLAARLPQLCFRSRTDVGPVNGRLRRPETQTNVLVPSPSALANSLALRALVLGVEEDVRLLLEGSLRLHGEFGRHDCAGCCVGGVDEGCFQGRRFEASTRLAAIVKLRASATTAFLPVLCASGRALSEDERWETREIGHVTWWSRRGKIRPSAGIT